MNVRVFSGLLLIIASSGTASEESQVLTTPPGQVEPGPHGGRVATDGKSRVEIKVDPNREESMLTAFRCTARRLRA